MQVSVKILDDVQDYSISQDEFFIGADESCEISLPYESIASRHIKVFRKSDTYYLKVMTDEYPTFLNDNPLGVGEEAELTTFFPVEIGGIFISFSDFEAVNLDIDGDNTTKFTIDFGEDLILDDKEVGSKEDEISPPPIKKEEETPKKKYRPEIYIPSETSEINAKERPRRKSRSSNVKATGSGRKVRKSSKVRSSRKTSAMTQQEFQNRRMKKPSSKSTIKSSMLFGGSLLLVCLVYYFYYYRPAVNERLSKTMLAKSKAKQKIPQYEIMLSKNPRTNLEIKSYERLLNKGTCLTDIEIDLCQSLKQAGLGIKVVNDVAYVFVKSSQVFPSREDYFLSEDDKAEIKTLLDTPGSDFEFSYNELAINGFISPSSRDLQKYELTKPILDLIDMAFDSHAEFIWKNPKIKAIDYIMLSGSNRLELKGSFKILRDSFERYMKNKNRIDRQRKLAYLTKMDYFIKNLISGLGDSNVYRFNPKSTLADSSSLSKEEIIEAVKIFKCSSDIEDKYCNRLKEFTQLDGNQGASLRNQKLFIVLDIDQLQDYFKNTERPDLTEEMIYLSKVYFQRLYKDEQKLNEFINNQYINNQLTDSEKSSAILLSAITKSDLISLIKEDNKDSEEFSTVTVVGYKVSNGSASVQVGINMNVDKLTDGHAKWLANNIQYFLYYKLPLINNFINRPGIKLIKF